MNPRTEHRATVPASLLAAAQEAEHVTVLTGAGMSAESGVPVFRDADKALWGRADPDEVATAEAWMHDPDLVWAWHWWLARLIGRCTPHDGHRALAEWARHTRVDVVTQNVDDLHERAGSLQALHLHGSLFTFSCESCARPYDLPVPPSQDGEEVELRVAPPSCPGCAANVRPDVVLFGERLPEGAFDRAVDLMLTTDLVLVVGTSGVVQPAASLPDIARGHGTTVVEINPQHTELSWGGDLCWREDAGRALPALVEALGFPQG
ncbi:NAD-dependent deacetylase [Austwickia chelonae]|uniref:protein acetyllysine N-acetyltransferase n=1 Tax=Austwickia chelonae NBRC 105200 TaxID=1184607 RepID=K6UMU8_9MICO|nr:NAD-dependent deacylase [Austwickia chelonae]GAB78426.1 NAD-dependent deacetylase [Austwickia chelonae NBRC 105200]SEW39410.1 NAD-dependent deacetylase [Austwickia chelonae]